MINSLNISSSPYVNALVLVLVYVVGAKAADIVVEKIFRRLSRFTSTDLDDRIVDLIHRPIFYSIIIFGLSHALSTITQDPGIRFYTGGILYSAVTAVWCITTIRVSNTAIEYAVYKGYDMTGLSKDIAPLIENVSKIVIVTASLMAVLSIWRINITPLLASAGIAGAAVAFAAKDMIANFFGGLSVFADKPFKIGDYIVLDKGERGEVVEIGVRSTRIKTRDDILITMPNSLIANSKIINESAPSSNFRLRIPVSVAYGSDIELAEKTLLEIASENGNVVPEPAPRVRFREFGESSLNFELLCWAKEPSIKGLAVHELNCAVYKKFNELGIRFPFPQRDVHLYRD